MFPISLFAERKPIDVNVNRVVYAKFILKLYKWKSQASSNMLQIRIVFS